MKKNKRFKIRKIYAFIDTKYCNFLNNSDGILVFYLYKKPAIDFLKLLNKYYKEE